jgi:hypothetical protein
MHASHVCAEGAIDEPSLIFFLSSFNHRGAFARCRHTFARGITALADQSSLYRGFTGSLVPLPKESLEE